MNAVEAMKVRRLVRNAYTLAALQPWDHQEKIGIVAIQLNNRSTPYYVVFLEQSIVVLPSANALVGLFMNATSDAMPSIQRLRYQHHLLCTFLPHHEVDAKTLKLYSESNTTLQAESVPFFESTIPTLLPDTIIKKEVDLLNDIYAQVVQVLPKILNEEHIINTDETMHVWKFNYETQNWELSAHDLPGVELVPTPYTMNDGNHAPIHACDCNDEVWEIDVAYTSIMLPPQDNHRQQAIRLCVIAHHENPLIYKQALVNQDDAHHQLGDELMQCMLERGRPQKILTRDQILVETFASVCAMLNIEIEANEQLAMIDVFIEELASATH